MVILSSKKILELRNLYNEKRDFQSLNVLKEFESISLKSENNSIPFSFDIPRINYNYDVISKVLQDVGIPSICIRSIFKITDGFHIQLYKFCM